MYIKQLEVKNFRAFKNIKIFFNQRFNLIIGSNGIGKTSLLRAIIYSYCSNGFNDTRFKNGCYLATTFNINNNEIKIGLPFKEQIEENIYREYFNYSSHTDYFGHQEIKQNWSQIEDFIPPLVLGAFRKIDYKRIDGMKKENHVKDSRNNYRENAVNFLNDGSLIEIKQWMINRYFIIEKEWAKQEKENWEWLLENFSLFSPQSKTFNFFQIERDLEPKFKIDGEICYLEELSAGFKSILSIVCSIFAWIESVNENKSVKEAEGIVLIDELDAHLHPEWQLTIRDALLKIFPKLQFIVTTHSPHLIASAKEKEIIILENLINEEEAILEPIDKSYSGWSTDSILEEIMNVDLTIKDYDKKIKEILVLFKEKNVEKLERKIKELEKVSNTNDTLITSFKIQLAELELGD